FPPDTLRLELGIQSLNPRVCAAINRPSYPEKELETLGFLRRQTNAIVHADLIAGLPGEDMASFGEGFDRLWRILTAPPAETPSSVETPPGETPWRGSFEIQLGILKGLPGTPLRELDEKFGMVYAPEPPYEVIETAALGREDLDRLRNFARFWELIVNRPWKTKDRSRNNAGGSAGVFGESPVMLPPGEPVFWTFMDLAEGLFRVFRRNWGIDRNALRAAILERPIPGGPVQGG
ncbi:MAG: DUF4080 domain-containing protein, partial [Spirochaetaceae bacterium]|nr:DUF4080 domain-containing protein [Spirochaetaceae bacterium]